MADNDNHTRLFPGLARQAQKAAEPEPSGKPGNVIPLRPLPEDPGPGPHTWSDDGGRRRGRARRIVLLAVLALLLAAAVAAVIWGSAADLDALRRSYSYRGLSADSRGIAGLGSLPQAGETGVMGRRVVLVNELGLQALDEDGSVLASCVTRLNDPVLRTGAKAALAYDPGKTTLCVISSAMQTATLTADAAILGADVSEGGSFCYLTAADSCKNTLIVHSAQFSQIFRWNSETRYLTAAALSDNGQTVAAVGAGSRDGAYWSSLLLLRTDSDSPAADIDLEERLVLWLDWIGDTCAVVCEDEVRFYSAAGVLLGSYALREAPAAAAAGDGWLALLTGSGRSGRTLLALSTAGAELGRAAVAGESPQLSAAGRYAALTTSQGVSIYTRTMAPYGEAAATLTGGHQRADGSVLLTDGQTLSLYLP